MDQRMTLWMATDAVANWLEGRENGDRQTWAVTCFDEHADAFLDVARQAGVTVQRIIGGGDDERYEMLVGEPGTGWTRPVRGGR
jgi:hypothetical protein